MYGSEPCMNKSKFRGTYKKYIKRVKGIAMKGRITDDGIRKVVKIESLVECNEQRQLGRWGRLQK